MAIGAILDGNGRVTNRILLADGDEPARYGAVPCPEGPQIGWFFADGVFFPPPPPEPEMADLILYADEACRREEYAGITVGGVPVSTTDRSKTLLLGARLRAMADPGLVEKFDALDGETYQVGAATIIAISDAIGAFVSDVFSAKAAIKAGIASGSVTTTAQIDALLSAIDIDR